MGAEIALGLLLASVNFQLDAISIPVAEVAPIAEIPQKVIIKPQVQKIVQAIKQAESGGDYQARGQSGEYGAYQFMPGTWNTLAKLYLGNSIAPKTKQNQDIVATKRLESLVAQGYGVYEIALIWNGGEPKVKKGITKSGVKYDSGAYARKIVSLVASS